MPSETPAVRQRKPFATEFRRQRYYDSRSQIPGRRTELQKITVTIESPAEKGT
jgi:hypothetical protein